MAGFQDIDAAGFQTMRSGGEVAVIDVRTASEVSRGGIAGATHVPLHLLPIKIEDLQSDVPTVLYCHSGGRSAQACVFLSARGFKQLYNLRGGVLAWVGSGFPLISPAG